MPPHSRTLRKGRYSQKGMLYLVTTRCRSRQPLFTDTRLGHIVVDEIRGADRSGSTKTFAFVVMPDHLHWLFELSGENSLSCVVKHLKGRAAHRINAVREKSTRVWQHGFHDRALRRMESLHAAGHYIANNPVRAGLVTHYSEYEMSYAKWH